MKRVLALVLALCFMSLGQAFADYYTFSYIDGTFSVSGTLLTAPGTGSLAVTDGSLTTAAFNADLYTGSGPIPAGTYSTSPSGAFIYDNTLSPGSTPMLTGPGLLFTMGTGNAYKEINIWGNSGAHDYSYWEWTGGSYTNTHDNGTFTVTNVSNVPVPPAAWLLGPGLFGLIVLRKRLKK